MPIKLPSDLPAFTQLAEEGVQLIDETAASRQDIRPMRIGLVNLMPDKVKTETQLARLLGATPLQIELVLLTTSTYRPSSVAPSHLQRFYTTWEAIKDTKFDGLIVTGAPIELMPFEEVKYWEELTSIFDWSQTHVHSTFNICWGAQAALYHFHGVPKHALRTKRFGVFWHRVTARNGARSPLLRGFDDEFLVPVSRHTEVRATDLPTDPGLEVLATSPVAGLCLAEDRPNRQVFMFNHLEYDTYTLDDEYRRDALSRADVDVPLNYYPGDEPTRPPVNRWRAYAHLLFGNWINEMYQTTPFELEQIGAVPQSGWQRPWR
ncbi:MAG: homoserine O-succinyltransferase [Pseudomonadota bacterium]